MRKKSERFKLSDYLTKERILRMVDAIEKGIPFKDLMSFMDDDYIESLYGLASGFYNDGRYKDSLKFFSILLFLDFYDPRFSIGLGACCQILEKYEESIYCYMVAASIAPKDPRPSCYCADCYLVLGDIENAMTFYKIASKTTEKDADKSEIREKAKKMYDLLIKENDVKV